jgi:hypothetical protein
MFHIAGLINLKIHLLLLPGGLTGNGYELVELATGVKREFARSARDYIRPYHS